MKAIIAIDSFKGSLTSLEAGMAAKEGILRVFDDATVEIYPIADGGEGTVDALVKGLDGEFVSVKVKDPLCRDIDAAYGMVNGTVAVMEMSAASGITLLTPEELSPMDTTTYGVGQMIADAIGRGCRDFVLGIGGSATNDGGVGMLQALGFSFRDANGAEVPFGAKGLGMIAEIHAENALPELKDCRFRIACDVTNPLIGENGCSHIYAPQKGATPTQVLEMDRDMANYAAVTTKTYPLADPNHPGAGAAGGLGFALLSYLNAELKPGIKLILDLIKFEERIQDADLVLTGEGKMDSQTVMGKAPVGIATLAKKYNIPVLAFAGAVMRNANLCNQHGIDALFPIVRTPCDLQTAMDKQVASANMSDTVEQALRLFAVNFRK